MTSRLSLVPPVADPWTLDARAVLGAEVGRATRAALITLDPKVTPELSHEQRRAACMVVMAWHMNSLDRRRPGWLSVATEAGWL